MGYTADIYRLTDTFGTMRKVREGAHTGIDLAMEIGTKLRSVIDGEVKAVFDGTESIGKGVRILGTDGREYIYGHMDKVTVKIGEKISFGDLIGESGDTGNSTGPHLHFAVRENGEFIDPIGYKEALDHMSGDLIATANDIPWWNVKARIEYEVDEAVARIKQNIIDATKDILNDLAVMLVDLSFGIALIGGATLLLMRAMGVRRATKYFWVLQLGNVLILTVFGGLRYSNA